ncbi:hypothetical protein B4065_1372 [Caldibacillus thermoamylovorans]|uniref:hypothetical protein n=1 Tax=Caldibacillus thermoamylovorans TaxID=35841 RepID=UPI0005A4764D|nr:hypothetical protein [Caldibacillus thermoamylovorans]KIO69706.1 hypothetical protein B4065_1372 [Caldibacillus thermoamylovorans]
MRDYPAMIGLSFLGIFLIVFISIFYRTSYTQNSIIMAMTETVRAAAIANADNSSRLYEGELFIDKDSFEKDFKNRFSNNRNVKISSDAEYHFKYLQNDSGSIKAIRVLIKDDETYQATCRVDISDG